MAKINMILTNGFDPDIRVYKEAKYLVEQGHKVEIFCWDREQKYVEKQDSIVDGIRIIRYAIASQPGSGFRQLPAFFKFIKRCQKSLKSAEYDYLHCHDLDGMIVGYFAKNKTAKLIFDMHEYYESGRMEKFSFIIRPMVRFFQNKSYKIIAVNNTQTQNMREENIKKLVYLPNYPEKTILKNIEKTDSESMRITYSGYVRDYEALSALMMAAGNDSRFEVTINGDGGCYDQIELDAKHYNNVFVTGSFTHDQIADFYNNTDVSFCLYNNSDFNHKTAIATKFFESIMFLTPLLVAKDTAMEEMCMKYNIGYGAYDTVEGIRQALDYLYQNPALIEKFRENMKKIQFNFCWETAVKKLDEIYMS